MTNNPEAAAIEPASNVASANRVLTPEELQAISGGLSFELFGYSLEITKDAVTICSPDKCVRVTPKSTTVF